MELLMLTVAGVSLCNHGNTIRVWRRTSPLADVASIVFTLVVVPLPVVDPHGQAVLTIVVVWVAWGPTQDHIYIYIYIYIYLNLFLEFSNADSATYINFNINIVQQHIRKHRT